MTNRGINEQLLEDMKAVVTKQREEWKKFTDELPQMLNDSRIIVYAMENDMMAVFNYSKKYDDWRGIGLGRYATTMCYDIKHLVKTYDLWKPLIIVKPDGKIE